MFGQLAKLLLAVALAAGIDWIHIQNAPASPLDQSEDWVIRPELAKVAALGFDAALADYYWLNAVQIVGSAQSNPAAHATVLGRMIDVVTTLDPWVDHPYRFAAVWLTDSPESVRTANKLLRRGMEHHPDEWRNAFYLGFNLFFYLGDNAQAADVLERSAGLPGSPAYLPRLVARLRSNAESLDTAAAFLAQLARDASDPAVRGNYLAALDEIDVERKARRLDAAREEFRNRHGRDIEDVSELAEGDRPVLAALPDAEPAGVPEALRKAAHWRIDLESGEIVSSHYDRRYRLIFHPNEQARREEWARLETSAESGKQTGEQTR